MPVIHPSEEMSNIFSGRVIDLFDPISMMDVDKTLGLEKDPTCALDLYSSRLLKPCEEHISDQQHQV